MLYVNGKPMLEWIIKRFVDQGFKDFIISIGYLAEQIEGYFENGKKFGCTIKYIWEHSPLGTAGALAMLPLQDESFIVVNGDVLASVNYHDLLRYHQNHHALATVGATTHRVGIPFGVLCVDGCWLKEIQEKPVYDYPIAAGIYVISPSALNGLPKDYINMPDFIGELENVAVFPISGEWYDIGRHEDLCSMNSLPS